MEPRSVLRKQGEGLASKGQPTSKDLAQKLKDLFCESITERDEWDQGKVHIFLGYLADLRESGPLPYQEELV